MALVTPSFNQARYLQRTIDSVLRQQYPQLNYLVQDGGSADGTSEVLAENASTVAFRVESDAGQGDAINRGFDATDGELMGWLNSDDLLLPGALRAVARLFAERPEVDVVYGNRIVIDEDDCEVGRWVLPRHQNEVLSWADYVPQETMFWRRRIWDRSGAAIDTSFQFAMDWDLLLRFREAGAIFHHLPRFQGAFRVHAAQKTSAEIATAGEREMMLLRQRALGRSVDHAEIHDALMQYQVGATISNALCKLGVTHR